MWLCWEPLGVLRLQYCCAWFSFVPGLYCSQLLMLCNSSPDFLCCRYTTQHGSWLLDYHELVEMHIFDPNRSSWSCLGENVMTSRISPLQGRMKTRMSVSSRIEAYQSEWDLASVRLSKLYCFQRYQYQRVNIRVEKKLMVTKTKQNKKQQQKNKTINC